MSNELNIYRRLGDETKYCTNFTSVNATSLTTIKSAEADERIWIDEIVVVNDANEWVEIYDGEDLMLGPIYIDKGVPLVKTFKRGTNLTVGNDLGVKTEGESNVCVIVEGTVDQDPARSISPSISSSPSASS